MLIFIYFLVQHVTWFSLVNQYLQNILLRLLESRWSPRKGENYCVKWCGMGWNPGGNRQKFGWAPCQRNSRWNDQESMGECKVLHLRKFSPLMYKITKRTIPVKMMKVSVLRMTTNLRMALMCCCVSARANKNKDTTDPGAQGFRQP